MTLLYKFLRTMFSWSAERALETAKCFIGCGATVYLMNFEGWAKLVGGGEAVTLYSMVLVMRTEKGAVPPGFQIGKHGTPQ